MPEREGRDENTEEAAGQCEGELGDILWDRGHCEGVLVLFGLISGYCIWHYAVFLCIYCFTGVWITLPSAGGSACIAITPLVRLHQVNRVLID